MSVSRHPEPPRAPRAPWTWACLACNATWVGGEFHACDLALPSRAARRAFWLRCLALSRIGTSPAELVAMVDRPIARSTLVAILGPSWASSADAGGAR